MAQITTLRMPKRCSKESFARRKAIAEALTALRHKAGLTKMDAAVRCGVSIHTWTRWEAGTASIPLERMADIRKALSADLVTAIRPHLSVAA